jgi:hypothetical protein
VLPRIHDGAFLQGTGRPVAGKATPLAVLGGPECGPAMLRSPRAPEIEKSSVALCEDVVSGIGLMARHPASWIVVTGPAMPEGVPDAIPSGIRVSLAFAATEAGDALAAQCAGMFPEAGRDRPDVEGQTWGEAFRERESRARREFAVTPAKGHPLVRMFHPELFPGSRRERPEAFG